jgi:hypothetical protein
MHIPQTSTLEYTSLMNCRLRLLLLTLWASCALLAVVLVAPNPSLARKPRDFVRWATPDRLTVALAPGDSQTVETSLTPLRRLGHVKVGVSSDLAGYLTVSPADFSHVKKNRVLSLRLTFHVSPNASTGTLQGMLTLTKIGMGRKPKPLSPSLAVILRVAAPIPVPTITTTTTSSTTSSTTTTQTTSTTSTTTSTLPLVWSPSQVTVTMAPGDSKTVQATAMAQANVDSAAAHVDPALTQFLNVSPSTAPPLAKGTAHTFTLSFTIPPGTPFRTATGTLHLRVSTTTIAQPLPITLNIWPSDNHDVVTLNYPPDWTPKVLPSPAPIAAPDLSALRIESPQGSLFLAYPVGGYGYDLDEELQQTSSQVSVAGLNARRTDFFDSDGFLVLTLIPVSDVPNHPDFRIEFRPTSVADIPLLEAILGTVRLR